MDFSHFDGLIGSSPVALAIFWFGLKVLKPLLEKFLDGLVNAIKDNTATVKELIDSQGRASEHQHAEHKEMIALLHVLTNSLLGMNGGSDESKRRDTSADWRNAEDFDENREDSRRGNVESREPGGYRPPERRR